MKSAILFVIAVCTISCRGYQDTLGVTTVGYLRLRADPAIGASADGATQVRLIASMPAAAPTYNRSVTFTTTTGSFAQSSGTGNVTSATVDSTGTALVLLTAPRDSGLAVIAAFDGSNVAEDTVQFNRALPDTVEVDIDRFALKATPTDVATITLTLRRNTGKTSPGTPVTLRALAADGTDLGLFGGISGSDTSGQIVVRYTASETNYRGTVTIVARAPKSGGGTVTGSITAVVVAP